MLIAALVVFLGAFGLLFLLMKPRHPQRPQRPQSRIIKWFKAIFTRPLDSYRARRQARSARLSDRRAEAEGGTELSDLRHRRGSRSVPGTQQGVVAENRGSETNPEDTDVDGTHGQDRQGTADNNSLAEPPPAPRSFV